MARKKRLLGAAGRGLGERLLLCLSLDGWRERDCSVFGFDLASSRFMALFQFFGCFVSYSPETLPVGQQFCCSSGAQLSWNGPAGAQSNTRAKDYKSGICLGLLSGEICSKQSGRGGTQLSMPGCCAMPNWEVSRAS